MGTDLLQLLNQGEKIYGTCIVSTSPIWSKGVKDLDLDFVFIDTEHLPIDRNELTQLCQVYDALGLVPIVRISSPDPFLACMARDAGALGVLAPYIEEVDQVRQLVGATKYRPLKGKALSRVLESREVLSPELSTYFRKYNAGSICLINIESITAVENLDDMLAVEGLDGVIIGPHDLSINMGLPEQYEHPNFKKTVEKIISMVKNCNKAVGIHFPSGTERQIEWAGKGANIILHSSDLFLFREKLREDLYKIKKGIGDTVGPDKDSNLAI
ncbi:HpcH/HpaI aldolase family protein [Pareuzebyella sediminis]|uniref:HpcH/HpaI aldolase family protein n=1 Tax=Pareuzebyella sediminis TaxID=2607998 RepID=UPI0011EDF100|nr:aldolase/citrate lyase family protein [Pareuzebyella sediminis]